MLRLVRAKLALSEVERAARTRSAWQRNGYRHRESTL